MAGFDYVSCNICGKRLFYDGDMRARNEMEHTTSHIVCAECVNKLQKKIEVLKKHDRRRH